VLTGDDSNFRQGYRRIVRITGRSGALGRVSSQVRRTLGAIPPLVQDTILAVVLAITLVYDLSRYDAPAGGPVHSADVLGYALVALLVLPLAFRRRYPLTTFAIILVDAFVVATLFYRPTSFGFGLIVATYTVGRWSEPRSSVIALVGAQIFGVYVKARALALGIDVGWFSWPIDVVYFGGAWFLGYSLRRQHHYATALEHSREELARRAVDDERTRIARELHDAVGHSVSVMLLQAGAAEGAIDSNPQRAKQALDSLGVVGRSALAEMDRFLGLLRADEPDSNTLLRASLDNLDALIEEFRGLELDIDATVHGDPISLPPTVDQSAFRIVQEALTNTLKHAGPTQVELDITYTSNDVSVRVRDHGQRLARRAPVPSTPGRQGIVGMRERAAVLDGELQVGPCDDHGFLVAVRMPIKRAVTT
jgi:signal transduction histidine kinase